MLAKRKIPKWGDFKVYGLLGKGEDGATQTSNHTTKAYPKDEVGQFFGQFKSYCRIGEYDGRLDISTLKLQFHFAQIPVGKGCGTTDRNLESV